MSIKQSIESYTSNTDHRTLGDYKEDNLVGEKGGTGETSGCFLARICCQTFFKNDVLLL